jgi:iron complex outermembrane receptor protein
VPLSTGELTFDANANGRTDLIRSFGSLADKAITAVGGYTLVDARVSYKPETQAWELSLWSKNLLDEKYKTLWGGDGDGSYFEVFGAPRTYGVQFSRFW